MKVLGRKLNRKAISPVIATLLMIAIAVAASILVYVWSMGLVGSLQGTGGQQTREQLIMEAYVATNTTSGGDMDIIYAKCWSNHCKSCCSLY